MMLLKSPSSLHLVVATLFVVLCGVVPLMAQTPPSVNLTRWIQPLPKPLVHQPYDRCGGIDRYNVTMGVYPHQFHPELPVVDLYGYGGSYPGLTFEAEVGRRTWVNWQNRLPEGHLLPTQLLLTADMGIANPPNSSGVVHLHGAHVQPDSDGYPLDYIENGEEYVFRYPNKQLPLTMWYHDHVMSRTRSNVHGGLAGFYFLRDKDEHLLGLPRGEFEMPLIIQDRILQANGLPFYPFRWGAFAGDTPVINGKAYPYFEVQPRAYRFRVLNACNSRFVRMHVENGPTIWQIGTDGGFLNEPVRVKDLVMGPSERADIIIDFYGYAGETLFLRNTAQVGFSNQPGDAEERFQQLLQFRVSATGGAERPYNFPSLKHVAHLPPLPKLEEIPPQEIAQVRNITMRIVVTPTGAAPVAFLLNGRHFHEEPEETPIVGTTEVWNLINVTPLTHPIHVHLVQFRILQRRPFNTTSFVDGQPPQFTGPARPPDANEMGWKDVARSNPGEVTTIMATFTEYVGWFVWHCHMLEHEDNDMMHPLVVMPADGSPAPAAPGSRSDGHFPKKVVARQVEADDESFDHFEF